MGAEGTEREPPMARNTTSAFFASLEQGTSVKTSRAKLLVTARNKFLLVQKNVLGDSP